LIGSAAHTADEIKSNNEKPIHREHDKCMLRLNSDVLRHEQVLRRRAVREPWLGGMALQSKSPNQ